MIHYIFFFLLREIFLVHHKLRNAFIENDFMFRIYISYTIQEKYNITKNGMDSFCILLIIDFIFK